MNIFDDMRYSLFWTKKEKRIFLLLRIEEVLSAVLMTALCFCFFSGNMENFWMLIASIVSGLVFCISGATISYVEGR